MRLKQSWTIFTIAILSLILATAAFAMILPSNENAKENSQAPQHSPVITEEGDLVKVQFIHYAKSAAAQSPRTDACYKLMGVKWPSLPVNYVINPTNPQGLSDAFVTSAISTSAETWDSATSAELFGDAYSVNNAALAGIQNYQNTIGFAALSENNVIAVTTVWFTRVGKRIVEFDQQYNTNFQWGDATIDSSKMDLQNIATHELGHAVGLSDIYSTSCTAVTMYGYSTEGAFQSRTLEQADITGLQKMYGI
jgi:hypothetical protein